MIQPGDMQQARDDALKLLGEAKKDFVGAMQMDEPRLYQTVVKDPRVFDAVVKRYGAEKVQAWVEKHSRKDDHA